MILCPSNVRISPKGLVLERPEPFLDHILSFGDWWWTKNSFVQKGNAGKIED